MFYLALSDEVDAKLSCLHSSLEIVDGIVEPNAGGEGDATPKK